jgi:uncharacterized membrane protein YsdA (DUF1294 family)/cold shock CspA family protein
MRHKGKVTNWKDDQGFGFITPSLGGKNVFLHISAFSRRGRRPAENDIVTYDLTFDRQKRPRASNVRFSRETPAPSPRGSSDTTGLTIAALFLAFVAAVVVAGRLPVIILSIYAVASIVAFVAYAIDKSAAVHNRRRTSESTLHLISLAGGWPGALLAQKMLHHKSRKEEFRRVYWATVVLNCAALVWLLTPHGSRLLAQIIRTARAQIL